MNVCENNIYNCDCLYGLKNIDDESIDLVVTSPPYDDLRKYSGFSWDFEETARELFRVVKKNGVVVWIVADSVIKGSETGNSFRQALFFKACGFDLYDTMIWEKPSPQAPTEGRYYDVFEYMFILSKGKPNHLNLLCDRENRSAGTKSKKETRSCSEDRQYKEGVRVVKPFSRRFNVWQISRGLNKTKHPAVFPLQLAKDHILSWSDEGDIVLDPFIGSGTTAVAAIETGRKFIGFDISKEYCEMANNRIKEAFYQLNFPSNLFW